MSGGTDDVRFWPAHLEPEAHERIDTQCSACGLRWAVHKNMAGHRLRCECGEWIEVPAQGEAEVALRGPSMPAGPPVSRRSLTDREVVDPSVGYAEPPSSFEPRHEIPTNLPMEADTLRHASVETRRKWKNRVVLEMAAIIGAFLVPQFLFHVLTDDRGHLVYLPLTDLISGVLVLVAGLSAAHYTFGGLKPTAPRFMVEGAVIGLAAAGLAMVWVGILEGWFPDADNLLRLLAEEIGLFWTLVTVGLFPAVFEELAFRGLLQGRLQAVYGRNGGILLSGIAFALAHGVSTGLPFHVAGGFYMGWLRVRSDSLYPCMITHLLYNGALVLSAA